MCGLTGYLLTRGQETNSEMCAEMLALQKHRGPDQTRIVGINTNLASIDVVEGMKDSLLNDWPNLVMGFNRLSILDLSMNGSQPMISQRKDVVLMLNGEIYNAFDFKNELINLGYVFTSDTDTEVVLYLYQEYGIRGLLNRLNGMFAIVIYDFNLDKLFLVRDKLGIKPLYVLFEIDRISFSSELKSFKALSNFKFELDEEKVPEFLLFRNSINETLFKKVINVEPGFYFSITSCGVIEKICYSSIEQDIHCSGSKSYTESKALLEDALRMSVKRQLLSDVRVGSQLSGGVDSSIITAYAKLVSESHGEYFETESIVFNNIRFSEEKYINEVVSKLELKSNTYFLDNNDFINEIESATWHFEQPLSHPNSIGIKHLSKNASRHTTVLLSGEGADELLGGYSRLYPASLFKSLVRFSKRYWQSFGLFRPHFVNMGTEYVLRTAQILPATAKKIYPGFKLESAITQRLDLWKNIRVRNQQLRKRIYEIKSYLPELLMRQDKMSMAHSIENRVPFLDFEFIRVALNIDDHYLYKKWGHSCEGKFILKDICSDLYSSEFSFRSKMGFSIPLEDIFKSNTFKSKWESEILPGIISRNIFNVDYVKSLMTKNETFSSEDLSAIWTMTTFEIWAKQYLD